MVPLDGPTGKVLVQNHVIVCLLLLEETKFDVKTVIVFSKFYS